ncbi:sugar ABC transporter substrate-binding protein [Ancylobacter sp. VNQ12]|uniref:sugar ABC transporter substrate-binding protein n=1 Tax=Ancylobacter sp. VNQ12 TaxID=3400920 RepID=UPI003C0E5DD8
MKRVAATTIALLVAAGIAHAQTKPSSEINIAVLMPNAGDPYFQSKAYGYVEEAKAQGVKLKMYNAGGYDHLPDQIRQVEDLTVAKVDGIIFTPTDTVATIPTIEAAIDAGIKVVNDDVLIRDSKKIPVRVSENSFEVGQQEGEMIVDALGGKGNVVMLKGPSGVDLMMRREAGAKSVFAKYPSIKIIAEDYHQSNIIAANRLMEDFIQAHPNQIDAVYTLGTQTAIGAVTALQAAGIPAGRVKVMTIDWEPAIEKMVNEGWVYGAVVCEPVKVARIAVQSVVKLVKGEPVPAMIYSGTQKVTKANVGTFDRAGIYTPEGWNPTSLYE